MSCIPCGRHGSWLWPQHSPSHCRHLEAEQAERELCLCLCLLNHRDRPKRNVLVCQGCCSKTPPTMWLQSQVSFFSHFSCLKGQDQSVGRVGSFYGPSRRVYLVPFPWFGCWLEIFGVPRLVVTTSCSASHSHSVLPVWVWVQISSSYKDTSCIALGSIPVTSF